MSRRGLGPLFCLAICGGSFVARWKPTWANRLGFGRAVGDLASSRLAHLWSHGYEATDYSQTNLEGTRGEHLSRFSGKGRPPGEFDWT